MKNRWSLAGVAVLMLAVGCGGSGPATDLADTRGTAEAGVSDAAKDFSLPALDGKMFALSRSDAKLHLIDFWATWCAPCREEVPMLNELHEAYKDDGLQIIAVSDESEDAIREFADDFKVEYMMLVDSGHLSDDYKVFGLPTAFLVDADGRIVDTMMGAKPQRVLESKIRDLLGLTPKT